MRDDTMTQRRRRLLVALSLLALLGVLALPGVHWRLVGWWRGEPFYDGRPASYWSSAIADCQVCEVWPAGDIVGEVDLPSIHYGRQPTVIERCVLLLSHIQDGWAWGDFDVPPF